MQRMVVLIALVLFGVGSRLIAQQDWSALTVRIEQAALAGSVPDLRRVRGDLLRRLTAEGGDTTAVPYALAYVAWRMAFLADAPERERDDLLDDAVRRLEARLATAPDDAEARGLLGALYGAQIARSPDRGMVLGARVGAAFERASASDPANPRVALHRGVSAFNTPESYGGGLDLAERWLRRSLELFATQPPEAPWPNWGRVDAHAWMGQVLLKRGDAAGARAEYDKALAIAPTAAWVLYTLIPALERGARE